MRVRGFTLVELLVVTAIIAILLAISLAALQHARAQVRSTLCQTRERQLLTALLTYEVDHGTLPPAFDFSDGAAPPGGYAGNMALDSAGWWWFNSLGMRSRDLFGRHPDSLKCPSRPITQPALWYNLLYGNYGLNWSVCKGHSADRRYAEFSGVPLASSRVFRASETLLLTDSGYAVISWYHVTAGPPFPLGNRKGVDLSYLPGLSVNAGRTLLPSQQEDAFGGRHHGKTVNVGFVDGHVEHRSAETLAVSQVEDGYANLSPLWKPLGTSAPQTGSVAP